jgi:DnaJ-domain-containing protein 1
MHHVCGSCGALQPVLSHEDYFTALGVPRKLKQDRKELEKHFYEISRLLHPDRFSIAGPETKSLSLARMSWVNQAYQTLRNPLALRNYLLELEGIKIEKSQMPPSLAEAWFEIQDLLMEDPDSAKVKLADFEGQLRVIDEKTESELSELESQYDRQPSRLILEKLAQTLQTQSYLSSLKRDIKRRMM